MNLSVILALMPVEQHMKDCYYCRNGKPCDTRQNVISRNSKYLRGEDRK